MRKFVLSIVAILLGLTISSIYYDKIEDLTAKIISPADIPPVIIDSTNVTAFFKKYTDLKKYKSDVNALYKKRKYKSIWYNNKGLTEFANLLYSKVNLLEEEGLKSSFPYKDKMEGVFNDIPTNNLSRPDTEIMLSSMYLFYAQKVFKGIDAKKSTEIGWFIPRKKISYVKLLDSLLADPKLLSKNEKLLFGQYYKLRNVLKEYRQIEKNGGWNPIDSVSLATEFKLGDSSKIIGQIRKRLVVTGDLKQDSKSNIYDDEFGVGILKYKQKNGFKANYLITSRHIQQMNVPVGERIKTIMVNMERCRWISPELERANQYLVINIPSFELTYQRNGKREFESNVFLGKIMTETVIFSATMNYIVFSPYWNVPQSIIESELKLAMDRDKNYLVSNDMESYKGSIRQKPGPKNPLGVVKFIFPNPNDIYLHDTPSQGLFKFEIRTFSHGCINLAKAKELAFLILKDDPDWPAERITAAMNGGVETTCTLKKKIPIHICYFTAWVNDSGEISFYNDVYQRDDRLAEFLLLDNSK